MVRIAVKLFLLFVLVYAGVSIWYGRLEEKLQQDAVTGVTAALPLPEKKTEILRKPNDYTIIVRRNIFEAVVVKTQQEPVEAEPEKLEPTKLKLSLMGTISGNESDARAIISDDAKREQDIFQVGDSIQGALIKEIERGKIVLVVNGKDEVLNLKDREGGGPAYTPKPGDYYTEPVKPQAAQPGQQVQRTSVNQGGRRPVVRPRPIRRPLNPSKAVNGETNPGLEK